MSAVRAKVLTRIPKKSVVVAVCEQIEEQIFSGEFAAGRALPPERELCRVLGVSRTPIREALARLERAGLVSVRQGGDTMVLDFRETAGLDLLPRLAFDAAGRVRAEVLRAGIEMRAELAPEIARKCAQRCTATTKFRLREVVSEMEKVNGHSAEGLARLHELSMRFWTLAIDGAENVAYQLAFNSLRKVYLQMRERVAEAMAEELRDIDGYRAIAKAIDGGAPEAAATATRAHVALGLEPMMALFRSRKLKT